MIFMLRTRNDLSKCHKNLSQILKKRKTFIYIIFLKKDLNLPNMKEGLRVDIYISAGESHNRLYCHN